MPVPEMFLSRVPSLAEAAKQWARDNGRPSLGSIRTRDDLRRLEAFDQIRKEVGPDACMRPDTFWMLVAYAGEALRTLRPESSWSLRSPGPEYAEVLEARLSDSEGWYADISGLVHGWINDPRSTMEIALLHAHKWMPGPNQVKEVR
jgi:hypothetical protein